MKKVVIIGGGMAGLAAAVRLKSKARETGKDVEVLLLEKNNYLGGKIVTERTDEFLLEGGPDSFLPEKYWTVDLARFLKIDPQMIPTNDQHKGTFIYSKKRLHPLPEGVMLMVPTMIRPLVTASLISWPGKIRMGMELFMPKRKDPADENLASFVTRRLGRECLEKIAEPLVAGIHTSNPDNMSVLATFPRFVELEQKHGSMIRGMVAAIKKRPPTATLSGPSKNPGASRMTYFMSFKDGMAVLPKACEAYIGPDTFRLNAAVSHIEPAGKRYYVHLAGGEKIEADGVMSAAASYHTAAMVENFDAGLAAQLKRITWSSSATVSVAFRRSDIKTPLNGFGFIVPRVEGRRINAATYSSTKWSYRAPDDMLLLRVFIGGGNKEEQVSELDDAQMLRMVLEEIDTIAGIRAAPTFSRIYRWFNGMPKYTVGHLQRMDELDATVARHPGLQVVGCSYKGIGIGDCINRAQVAADAVIGTP